MSAGRQARYGAGDQRTLEEYGADDQALDLLQTNNKFGEGSFACDSWRSFSDVDESQGDHNPLGLGSHDLPGPE